MLCTHASLKKNRLQINARKKAILFYIIKYCNKNKFSKLNLKRNNALFLRNYKDTKRIKID